MANGPSYKQLSGYALVPAADTLQKTPTYVIITNTGSYAFSYPDRSNGQTTSSFITGSCTSSIKVIFSLKFLKYSLAFLVKLKSNIQMSISLSLSLLF